MSSSHEIQAVQATSLHKRRQAILGKLAIVNRQIGTTEEKLKQLEKRMAILSHTERKAA
jgi:hypothetical protein